MSDKTYDTLRFIALIIAPIVTFVGVVVNAVNIPHGDAVVAILAGLDVCFGAIVEIARKIYYKKQEGES